MSFLRNGALGLLGGLVLLATPVAAQQYPSRQITLVVPFTAGGQQDVEARALAESMSKRMNTSVIVDNRPGGGSAIGIGLVAKAPPDGYTLLVTGSSVAQLQFMRKDLGFDPSKDLVPISYLSTGITMFVTNKATGVKTWQDFVAYANKNPGKANYASLGVGSVLLAFEALKQAAKANIAEVPYKGMSEYITALLRDDVQLIMGTIGGFKQHIETGDMVPLMIINDKRIAAFPNVPSTGELGYGASIRPFAATGFYAPTGTPKAVLDKLYDEVAFYVKQPETLKRAENFYTEMIGSNPAEAKKTYDDDVAVWGAVAKSINMQPQ